MLDIKFVRENPDIVRENIKKKFQDKKLPLVDEVIELDKQVRSLKQQGDELAKKRLNYPIGASYSLNIRGYRCPMIRYYAVTGCNKHLINLASVVNIFGKVLLFNTDGFWAILNRKDINKIVAMANQRGETFGDGLGQWKIDHNVDKFRIKSRGAYEYVEEGKYHPVIRGRSILDRIKPREEWKWGDIYKEKAVPSIFSFTEEGGVKLDGKKI